MPRSHFGVSRGCLLAVCVASVLAAGAPARAGDVTIQLDAATGFSITDNASSVERLRVDEATGNISRNGALFVHTTGVNNLFVGSGAGNTGTSGTGRNAAFGRAALELVTTGRFNSAFGASALAADTTGAFNSALGASALFLNSTGDSNVAVGLQSLIVNTSGSGNVAVGVNALSSNSTGNGNIALGVSAGFLQTTGSDNVYLANPGITGEGGQIRIGTAGTHVAATIAGIRGVTTAVADAIPVLIDSNGQLGTVSSSRSVKKEIRDMGDATARLLELRPVTYRYRQAQNLPSGEAPAREYGLIAEEVAEILPDLVVFDAQGRPFTVKYHEMAPMLLNEAQKERRARIAQQDTIERQARVIEAQQQELAEQRRELASVVARLGRLEGARGAALETAQR